MRFLRNAGQNIRKLVKDGFIIRKPEKVMLALVFLRCQGSYVSRIRVARSSYWTEHRLCSFPGRFTLATARTSATRPSARVATLGSVRVDRAVLPRSLCVASVTKRSWRLTADCCNPSSRPQVRGRVPLRLASRPRSCGSAASAFSVACSSSALPPSSRLLHLIFTQLHCFGQQ